MNKLKDFVIKFFQTIKAEIEERNELLVIKNIPQKFEEYSGKKAPYYLVFEEKDMKQDYELIVPGSSLLNTMKEFLEGSGSTTLLKLDFNIDPTEKIMKHFDFKNCEVKKVLKSSKNNFFSRFTFMTYFQYLNKKEQLMNESYVHNGKIIVGDLSDYPVVEGNKEEFDASKVKQDYLVAKEKLKELLKPKIESISKNLNENILIEIERIEKHYETQLREYKEATERNNKKIKELTFQLSSQINKEEKSIIEEKIKKLVQTNVKFEDSEEISRIIKERDSVIRDEKVKNSLDIKNKLLNTTIIYYPLFCFSIALKNRDCELRVNINYDPLTQTISELNCNSCNKPLTNVYVCSSGHVSCRDCLETCSSCSKSLCKKCLNNICNECNTKLCKSCTHICPICRKSYCKNHFVKDDLDKTEACIHCLKFCKECNSYTNPRNFRDMNGKSICQRCYSKEMKNQINKSLFKKD